MLPFSGTLCDCVCRCAQIFIVLQAKYCSIFASLPPVHSYLCSLYTYSARYIVQKYMFNNARCVCSWLLTKWVEKERDLACLSNVLSNYFPLVNFGLSSGGIYVFFLWMCNDSLVHNSAWTSYKHSFIKRYSDGLMLLVMLVILYKNTR